METKTKRLKISRIFQLGVLALVLGLMGQGSVSLMNEAHADSFTDSDTISGATTSSASIGLLANIVAIQRITLDCPNNTTGGASGGDFAHDFTDLTSDTTVTTTSNFDEDAQDSSSTVDSTTGQLAVYALDCTITTRCAGAAQCSSATLTAQLGGADTIRVMLFDDTVFTGTTLDFDTINSKLLTGGDAARDLDAADPGGNIGADIISNSPGAGTQVNNIDLGVAISESDSAGSVSGTVTFSLATS